MRLNQPKMKLALTLVLLVPFCVAASEQPQSASIGLAPQHPFVIHVVDQDTEHGVPLVELRTTNNIQYFTDSHGIVAFYEPGLMNQNVFFLIDSHGYEYPKDGFGYRGKRLKTTPDAEAVIKLKRINIAERLYRITGQGIYRDSILAGLKVPLKNPELNGQVMGQDSVFTCQYKNRIFWMWGDTGRPSYPLGNFAMSGAFSEMPERGGLAPEVGVDLEYLVDKNGFSRPISPMKEPGMVWLDSLMNVTDEDGQERMVARFTRLKDLSKVLERGLVAWNDSAQSFEPIVRGGLDILPFSNTGHAFEVQIDNDQYYYFTTPSPVGVRMRVKAQWDYVTDPNRYEVLTALGPKKATTRSISLAGTSKTETPYRWIVFADLIEGTAKANVIKKIEREIKNFDVYDIESGQKVSPHNGTVYYNPYRNRWIAIFVQHGGKSSFLGEVWCAEADTPAGPWCYARKIVTHNKYSFYNPAQHPLFDRDAGRTIFFEGTYSYTFSGSLENATPRYDYNQIMYQLDLDDQRLVMPVAVYQMQDGEGYLLYDKIEEGDKWDRIESILFFAIEPDRASDEMVAVYAVKTASENNQTVQLTTKQPSPSTAPLFCALPAEKSKAANQCIIGLYEYQHAESKQRLYSTKARLDKPGWNRSAEPLCRVWKVPEGVLLLDRGAKPSSKP